jgi:DNA invertase Pin-like site-specific DNA recombinase
MIDWEPWVGYIRVSTWREEKISPDIQRTAIEAWAARTRRRIIAWVIDLDATGRNFKRKIMQCIEGVEHSEARGVAVWKFSRFGRNMLGVKINLARLEDAGGELESATEPVDAHTAVGELQRDLLFAFAAFESNRAGEQWRETHALRVAAGVPATGRARFGYLWTPRKVHDPESPTGWRLQPEGYSLHADHAPIVDEMYERKTLDHDGYAAIGLWLNDDLGIPTSRGNPWAVSSVRRYLDSGFAAGLLRIHDPECRCPYRTKRGTRSQCTEGRMLYVPGAHPAIITPDRWQAYLDHRAQTRATPPRARKALYPLSRLLRHGACRGHLAAASGTIGGQLIRGYSYTCATHNNISKALCPNGIHVQRERIEAELLEWLRTELDAPIGGRTARPASATPARPATPDVGAELARVEKALARAATSHAKGLYDDDEYIAVRDALRADREALLARQRRTAEVAALPTRESVREVVAHLVEAWKLLTPVEANTLLRRAVHRVVVHDVRDETYWVGIRVEVHPSWEPDPWEVEGEPAGAVPMF